MIINEKYREWLPTIVGAATGIAIAMFLSGYLWPIEKPQDGDAAATGIGIIIFAFSCIGALLQLPHKK
ncbi:hypothetical protein J8K87_16020 [Bacteroides fragilis]|uniref:hypothetical protein n=1 Tax=Bacteroides fragilis TaxID=817 RepID=UPI001CA9D2CB|nr:hypothetical protein [Bacteroides fragilis]MBY2897307.1 hypothetical protein [Bacteroides fragilis]MCM0328224.1 hypothetical protein [Bacteroides fragilis]MCM0385690.1 hypothetical protein [Bacteroides fragilis]